MGISNKKIEGDQTVHYVSQRQRRPRPKPKMQPNMTPMIDVTFQLLLFFLQTMEFREDEGTIPGSLPQKGPSVASEKTPLKPVRITLRPVGQMGEGVVYEMSGWGLRIESAPDLYEKLMARRSQLGDEIPILIHPLSDVRWEFVVEAFNQAVRARFKNIGFASDT